MSESIAVERLDVENSLDLLQRKLHQQRYDFALARISSQDHVLEIGTGAGVFSKALAEKCAYYVGLDVDRATCEKTRLKLGCRGTVIEGDAQYLPFKAEDFTVIVCLEVLEHLEDFRRAIREIRRCLKPDGSAIISVPYVKHGGPSAINKYHLYEPGEGELIQELRTHFGMVERQCQFFPETRLMTFARRFHLRRLMGFADVYRGLIRGDVEITNRIQIAPRNDGFCFNLIVIASKPRAEV